MCSKLFVEHYHSWFVWFQNIVELQSLHIPVCHWKHYHFICSHCYMWMIFVSDTEKRLRTKSLILQILYRFNSVDPDVAKQLIQYEELPNYLLELFAYDKTYHNACSILEDMLQVMPNVFNLSTIREYCAEVYVVIIWSVLMFGTLEHVAVVTLLRWHLIDCSSCVISKTQQSITAFATRLNQC